MHRLSFASVLLCVGSAACTADDGQADAPRPTPLVRRAQVVATASEEASRWFEPTGPARAVVVVVHGLNLRPSRMDAIAEVLASHGALVYRLGLPGHVGPLETMQKVTREAWLDALVAASQEAHVRAEGLGLPLDFLGYSLGGLLYVDMLTTRSDAPRFDRAILLAPALTPRWFVHLAPMSGRLLGDDFVIASFAPEGYRRHVGTSVRAYKALLASVRAVAKAPCSACDVPTWIVIDAEDETVDVKKLGRWIAAKGLGSWELETLLSRGPKLEAPWRHLIIDRPSLGDERWRWLESELTAHLGLEP